MARGFAMTYRAHLVMVAAVVLAACGDDTSFDQAGQNDAALATEGASRAKAHSKIGGTVSGLAGAGLVLELNGEATLAVQANGRFHFDRKLSTGDTYAVTVKVQPTSVVQTCAVSNGTGVVAPGNVRSVSVTCSPTGRFVATGALTMGGRFSHSATRLSDGQVLIVGGCIFCPYVCMASAELYDPVTGTFAATGSLDAPRYLHSATLLPDGKVLIAGGTMDAFWTAESSAELYDPTTRSFAPIGGMNQRRAFHTATPLTDGKVLIVGGYAGDEVHSNTAEVYDPATGTFAPTGSPVADRYGHLAARAGDGKVLVVGGSGSPLVIDAVRPTFPELYDPAAATFSSLEDRLDRHLAATALADGRVLITGDSLAELYDPATQQFEDAGPHACAAWTATLLANGAALLVSESCAEIFDPATRSFAPTDTPHDCLPTSATSLEDGDVLVTCSSGGARLYEILPPLQ